MPLRDTIRTIADCPKAGIQFRDITTLLADAAAFREAVDALTAAFRGTRVDTVAGIEARGFILGGALAHQLRAGFVPLRKKGKLPSRTYAVEYALEYGTDVIEMHHDAVEGRRVLLIDDLIATGGTAEAAVGLIRQGGGEVVAAGFVIDLPELGGADRVRALGVPVTTLVAFDGH